MLSERKPDSRLLSEDILERADEKAAPWLRGAGVEMGWGGNRVWVLERFHVMIAVAIMSKLEELYAKRRECYRM